MIVGFSCVVSVVVVNQNDPILTFISHSKLEQEKLFIKHSWYELNFILFSFSGSCWNNKSHIVASQMCFALLCFLHYWKEQEYMYLASCPNDNAPLQSFCLVQPICFPFFHIQYILLCSFSLSLSTPLTLSPLLAEIDCSPRETGSGPHIFPPFKQ